MESRRLRTNGSAGRWQRFILIRWRRRLLGLLLVGVVAVGIYLGRGYVLPPLANWLDVGVTPQSVDYVMVLPGDESLRPFVAAALVKVGLAGQVLVPKTESSPAVEDRIYPPADEVIRRVLVYRGVPQDKIVILDGKSSDTSGDALALATFLESSPNVRVAVVTNDYHTRRTRWIFAVVLGDRARQVSFVSSPTESFRADNWWESEAGFVAIVGEYLKLAFAAVQQYRLHCLALAVAALAAVIIRRTWRGGRKHTGSISA